VVFHVLVISLDASPTPSAGMNRAAWKEPTVQGEFKKWAGFLGVEQQELEDKLWSFATEFVGIRRSIMSPLYPYLEATGTSQSWQMFVAPHRFPTKMELQIKLENEYLSVFEEHSETATWNKEAFGTERLRASIFRWGWVNYQESWKRACWQFAGMLLEENPEASSVRCRMQKKESPSPEALDENKVDVGKYVFVVEYSRERRAKPYDVRATP
jgi:hypothetical protein